MPAPQDQDQDREDARAPRGAVVKRERSDSISTAAPRKKRRKATDDRVATRRRARLEMAAEEYHRAGDKARRAASAAINYKSAMDAAFDRMVAINMEQEKALQDAGAEIDLLKAREQDTLGKLRAAVTARTRLRNQLEYHKSIVDGQDLAIAQHGIEMDEKDAELDEAYAQLDEKDTTISRKNASIARKKEKLNLRAAQLRDLRALVDDADMTEDASYGHGGYRARGRAAVRRFRLAEEEPPVKDEPDYFWT